MRRNLPPYPTGDLNAWARQITDFLISAQNSEQGGTKAAPVALQHKVSDERAFQDGVLMYDPITDNIVVSVNNVWEPLSMGTNTDAFGRLRVSEPTTLFDSKQIFDNQPLYFDDQEVSGSGTGSVWSKARASSAIAVAATTAGKRVRQTFQRFNYQPGKSQLILCTGILDLLGGGTGITTAMGYFDDDNGIFASNDEGVPTLTIRSSVGGSAVNDAVAQSAWNGDKLDGTGASGITLDLTKTQIWWCDIEWLGVGSVRCGYVIDGSFVLCHTFHHANSVGAVYMSTPNLPIRYEIENDGTGALSTMEHICSTVISEGGLQANGQLHYVSTEGTHLNANTANVEYAVIGLRLKSTHIGQQIDFVAETMLNATSDDFEWTVKFNPTVAGTFTYADVANTSLQAAIGATANTVTGGVTIAGGMAVSTNSGGAITSELNNALRLGVALDGTLDTMVLCVRPLSANADIEASLAWRETV